MKFTQATLPGVYVVDSAPFFDNRGSFVKVFNKSMFADAGIDVAFDESYYSVSKKDVIRGMHFQNPPDAVAKLVYVTQGEITDVVLDLRRSSPTFGKFETVSLSSENAKMLFVPIGIAHGFLAQTSDATVVYMQSKEYCKESDAGILWNSFGMDWAIENPILSPRDASFTTLAEYSSPFV